MHDLLSYKIDAWKMKFLVPGFEGIWTNIGKLLRPNWADFRAYLCRETDSILLGEGTVTLTSRLRLRPDDCDNGLWDDDVARG